MKKYVATKWGALVTVISSALLLHGCQTSAGNPTICEVGSQAAQCKVAKKNVSPFANVTSTASSRNY